MSKLKLVVLGALAATAVSLAAGAVTASANVVLAEKYPSTLAGAHQGALEMFTSWGTVGMCYGDLSGSASAPTDPLKASLPKETKCASGVLKSNSCSFVLHPGVETGSGQFPGTFDISTGCTGLTTELLGCKIKFPPQSGMSATFQNTTSEGKEAILVTLSGEGMEYTTEASACSANTYHNGTLRGSWMLSSSTSGTHYGIHVANRTGLFLGGEGSPEGPNPPRFELEKTPAAVIGKQTTLEQFEFAAGTTKCERVNLGGVASQSTNEVLFVPEFEGCKAFGLKATVQVNGCQLGAYVLKSSPYSGTLGLGCPSGKQLEINAGAGSCVVSIAPQAIAANTYEVVGSGAERKVVATMKGEGLEYTQTGVGCLETGTFHNGVFSGAETFEGWS